MKQLFSSPRLPRRFYAQSLVSLLAVATVFHGHQPAAHGTLIDSPKVVVDEVWQLVDQEFVDHEFNQVDWRALRSDLLQQDYQNSEAAYEAIKNSLKRLGDPYTRFLPPQEFESLTTQTSGEMTGIGIRLGLNEVTGDLVIQDAIPNSPAAAAGLQAGDVVIKIDGDSALLLTLEQASEMIRGQEGTEVRLSIRRDRQQFFDVRIERARIELPTVTYHGQDHGGMNVGYIKLEEFGSHAAEQMERAIAHLTQENVEGFVLDLRGNPGGLLFASVDIARLWMEEGAIVRTVDRQGGDRQFFANHTALTDLPLVVLVDGNSASASEILAGALKDNQRAVILGSRTYGKGTVQSVHSLSDGSGVAITISRYYPPSGININHKGITPDVTVELTRAQQSHLRNNPHVQGTLEDTQYVRALSLLAGHQSHYSLSVHPPTE